MTVYPARQIKKRERATAEEMANRKGAIYNALVRVGRRASVRHVFYLMAVEGIVEKSQKGYNKIVYALGRMRKDGDIPYHWIVDNTRWMMKSASFDSTEEFIQNCVKTYRKSLWSDAEVTVEVWCESDSIAGVLIDITDEWDVPLMATKGFSSLSFTHAAAESLSAVGRPAFIYYFGDYDPSGKHIAKDTEKKLRKHATVDIHFEQLGVLPWQIDEWNLPGKPPKNGDSRAKNFKGECVEVEAIPPNTLKGICKEAIMRHLDQDRVDRLRVIEGLEREQFRKVTAFFSGGVS